MANSIIQILDTGKRTPDGSVDYTQVNSGSWIDLYGFTLRGEFTNSSTNNAGQRDDTSDSTKLTFIPNETAAVIAPRFTIQGLVPSSSTETITNIVELGRTKGIKQLAGGLGLIEALPEASLTSPTFVYVIIKNITFSEVVATDVTNIAFTIQLEQVQ